MAAFRASPLLLVLFGCAAICLTAEDVVEDVDELSDVLEVDIDTLQPTIEQHSLLMIMFYAPWCGACKKFTPEFEAAATELKGTAVLAKLNSWDERHTGINKEWKATSYPTVWIVRDGERTEYDGDLDTESVVRTMKRKARPVVVDILFPQIPDFVTHDPSTVSVIGYFESRDSPEFAAFMNTARQLRDIFSFALVDSEPTASEATVFIHKDFDEGVVRVEGPELLTLNETLLLHRFPVLNEITKSNSRDYINSRVPLAFVFVDSSEQRSTLEHVLRPVAMRVRGKLHFVFLDWNKYGSQAEKLGLSGDRAPAIAIDDTSRRVHYAFDETSEITTSAVDGWVSRVLSGELFPTMRSEPVPESQDEPVYKVVQATFDEIVRDPTKDVFLEIYAPWCGHCKTLKPVWDELAQALQTVPTIRIAAMDGTANDVDPTLLNGFPALLFYPANQKQQPVVFVGKQRTYDALLKFASEHASFKFSLPTLPDLKDEL